jgi:hypothetical protein
LHDIFAVPSDDRSDGTEVARGAAAVARRAFPFTRTAKVIVPAVINGARPGHGHGRQTGHLVGFTITDTKITAIDLTDDPHRTAEADLAILDRARPPAPCLLTAREAVTSDTTATPTVISTRFVHPLER